MTSKRLRQVLCGVTCLATMGWAMPALAQKLQDPSAPTNADSEEPEILVTARRRDEALQDVPLVVNVVTPKTLENLQIRQFQDIAQTVPGLTLSRGGLTSAATLRGVNFDAFVSASSATVETYLNDTAIPTAPLFQSLFDIGQIEVLRGPQGTLRGRASPSGSITVTTHRPSFEGIGATASVVGSLRNNFNGQVAFNIPMVQDILAVRMAGFYDTLGKRVSSVNSTDNPFERSWGGRVSVLMTPTDTITLNGMYQRVDRRTRAFAQVESANLINPALPASPFLIGPFDRLAVASDSTVSPQKNNYWNWSAEWRVLGQKLNYVGGLVRSQNGPPNQPTGADNGNFFDTSYPQPQLAAFGIQLDSRSKQTSHEIRLSSDDRLFGMLDYIVGYFQAQNTSRSLQGNFTPVFLGAVASPLTPVVTNTTPVDVLSKFKESSFFGNLTLHLGDKLEVAGGPRRISFRSSQDIAISGVRNAGASYANHFDATIYSGSVKYRFNQNLMAYASIGTSWRPAPAVVGDFSLNQTPLERSFINLGPETSKSYEGGFRSTWLDGRLTLNATYYHQSFKNYPYRPVQAVSFVSTNFNTALGMNLDAVLTGPGGFNFVAPVPVKVDGVEAEAMFQATKRWNIGVNLSYTHGRFSGIIPCNDYNPRDGKPDVTTIVPTVAQVRAVTGGDNLSTCNVTQSSNQAPSWSGTLQSEYHFPVREGTDAFIRGFATYYGNSANDPTNAVDNVPKYVLANAFAGLRDADGGWEVSLFAKNFTNVKRVLTRNPGVLSTNYATLTGSKVGSTTYRTVSTNDPREIGISLRMAIGSR